MVQAINKNSWHGAMGSPDKFGNTVVIYDGMHIAPDDTQYIFRLSLVTIGNMPSVVTLSYEGRVLNKWSNHPKIAGKVIDELGKVTTRSTILSDAATFAARYVELCDGLKGL